MGVIGLAIGFYQPCIFCRCNRTEESMKARCPLRMNETLAVLGTPYHVKVYAKIFSCHAPYNWIMDECAKKIFALSAAPLALIANKILSRPYGRAYSLPALRALCMNASATAGFLLAYSMECINFNRQLKPVFT